jgi:hypothetical protein
MDQTDRAYPRCAGHRCSAIPKWFFRSLLYNGRENARTGSRGRPDQVDSARKPGVRFTRSSAHGRQREVLWIPQLGPALLVVLPTLRS